MLFRVTIHWPRQAGQEEVEEIEIPEILTFTNLGDELPNDIYHAFGLLSSVFLSGK